VIKYALLFFLGAGLSLVLTPVARWLALRAGAVDVPDGRRVHQQPTARFGGLAIFLSMVIGLLLAALVDPFTAAALAPRTREGFVLIAGAIAMVIIGTIDDRRGLGAWLKLALEVAIAAAIAACGYGHRKHRRRRSRLARTAGDGRLAGGGGPTPVQSPPTTFTAGSTRRLHPTAAVVTCPRLALKCRFRRYYLDELRRRR